MMPPGMRWFINSAFQRNDLKQPRGFDSVQSLKPVKSHRYGSILQAILRLNNQRPLRRCDLRLLTRCRPAASRPSANLELFLGKPRLRPNVSKHGPLPNLSARPFLLHHGRVFRRVRIGRRGDARGSHTPGTFSRGRSLEKAPTALPICSPAGWPWMGRFTEPMVGLGGNGSSQ